MPRRLAFLLVPLLAGCSFLGGGDGRAIEAAAMKNLVLQPADLPRAFIRFDEGQQGFADNPGGTRADPRRFGRVGGWKSRFRRRGTTRTKGPLVVESRVDLFESRDGAEDELAALRDDVAGEQGWVRADAGRLGDESEGFTLTQPSAQRGVRYYLVAWRDANVTASVLVSGFSLTLTDAVALARKQQRRIAAAAA